MFFNQSNDKRFKYWFNKCLDQDKEIKNLERDRDSLEKQVLFLKDEQNSKCSKNDRYEIARRYLLGCLTFNGGNCSYIRINVSELFKVFNIPFDLCIRNYEGESGYNLFVDVNLKIEEPRVMELKDINIDEVITKKILDELIKEQNNEKDEKGDN